MTIAFFSNFLNHHQLPICLEFIRNIGKDNFRFVACERIEDERVQMGYEDMNVKYPFVLRAYESEACHQQALKLAETSDVAIIGHADSIFIQIRAKENKLTFLFRERIFKNGSLHRFFPTTAWKIYKAYLRFRNKNVFILCASAYAADDFSLCGFPRHKCLKWGYFPEFKECINTTKGSNKLKLMWCGRMLWWKHPEHAVEIARMLKEHAIDFEMRIIGNGEMKSKVNTLIEKYNLSSHISMFDFMSPDEIRRNMLQSDIYLFTSGREEGWGVVLNEAMNSQCAIIANVNAGSTPYLMKNGETGYIYDGSMESLKNAVEQIIHSDSKSMGIKAYNQIKNNWSPVNAVTHLLNFIKNPIAIAGDSPCNKA